MKAILALGFAVAANLVNSAELPAAAQREIDALLARLSDSGCRFQRNGSWHGAADARAHIERKYRYLLDRKLVGSAEDFIALAASKSSLSGEAYRVRCGESPAQGSAEWLGAELKRMRGAAARDGGRP